ncbi:MAG TPA: hypothetical protein VK070_14175 [Acidimicrobiia bacterium]|nr:hypothetical protein [Acidimicrobiia bacterium]
MSHDGKEGQTVYPTIAFGHAIIEQRIRNHHASPHRRLRGPGGNQ